MVQRAARTWGAALRRPMPSAGPLPLCPGLLTALHARAPLPAPPAAPRAAVAFTRARPAAPRASVRAPLAARRVVAMASSMQFIKGIDEPTIPDVKLTRSRDGSSGTGAPPLRRRSAPQAGCRGGARHACRSFA